MSTPDPPSEEVPRINGELPGKSDTNGNTNGAQQQQQQQSSPPPPVPPRGFEKPFDDDFMDPHELASTPVVGTKLEGLVMDEFEEDFNPRAYETASNGFGSHQSSNSMTNGGSSPFLSTNGSLSTPPPLCRAFL